MRALVVSAMQSGAGKTVLACALMRALQRAGASVAGFKCGPDYLDPTFHSRVLGVPSHNLDLFLQGEAGVRGVMGSARAELGVIEGAMGLYDGVAGSEEASAWQLATREELPVVLAVRPAGNSLTLAAQIRGVTGFRTPNPVAAVVLTNCGQSLAAHLSPLIERECDLPVLGFLPPMEEASFASRHLGLVAADEICDLERRIDAVAAQLAQSCDLDALAALMREVVPRAATTSVAPASPTCRIAVARDEAFCFYYEAGLARLAECGAKLVDVSPLHDTGLPACDALYLGGGYPELHAARLSANASMRRSVCEAVRDGLPTIAECGGFMYLQQELVDASGTAHAMAQALPGRSVPAGRLVRFGYAHLVAQGDSLLLRAGERLPVHEFHHWDSTRNGNDLVAQKPSGSSWRCCWATPTLYAGFPHLHLAGELPLVERLVAAGR